MKDSKKHFKKSFTLMELLITISLIALAISVIGVGARKLIQKERFSSSTTHFVQKLKIAQELALDYDTDISLQLRQEEKGVKCVIFTPPFVPHSIRLSLNNNSLLSGIKKITLNGGEKKQLEFTLNSYGIVTPLGKVELIGEGNLVFPLEKSTHTYTNEKITLFYPIAK